MYIYKNKIKIILLLSLVFILSAFLSAEKVSTSSWPQFRGPDRNGINTQETGLLKTWPAGGPKLLWKYDTCGVGYAGIVISDNKILTAGTFPEATRIIALDMNGKLVWTADNGEAKWKVPSNKKKWASIYGGVRATPAIAGNRLFHMGVHGRLAAYELGTGKEIWNVNLKECFKGIYNEWGYSESVLIEDNRLYCLPGGAEGFMACIDALTGKTIWVCKEIPDKKASNASAAIIVIDGVKQIVTMTTVLIVGVRAADGKMLWQFRHANRFRENCEIPQYVNGILYASSGYRHGSEGYDIAKNENGTWSIKQVWRTNPADNLHGGPIILDDHVYAAGYDNRGAFCLELKTGKFKWRHQPIGRSSYTYADGLLYRLGEKGRISLELPDPNAYKQVSSFRLPSAGPTKCLTHPVVFGKRLYIRHDNNLYCYDIAAK